MVSLLFSSFIKDSFKESKIDQNLAEYFHFLATISFTFIVSVFYFLIFQIIIKSEIRINVT